MSRYDDLMALHIPPVTQHLTRRDTALYALGVGAGPAELPFLLEDRLVPIPSMAVTLAYPGFFYRDLPMGLDANRILHASEHFVLHRPLPVEGVLYSAPRIATIHDKGPQRGSLIVSDRQVRDADGNAICTVTSTAYALADGGLGGPVIPSPRARPVPERAADETTRIPTDPRAALIYRLSGDLNPLHVDPDIARQGGHERPILHGLATLGHVCRILVAKHDAPLVELSCRFTGPVIPGETLGLETWHADDEIAFRASTDGRPALDSGWARFGAYHDERG